MNSAKILIVDDEPFNVDYLEQELEETGCQTISAANGQEALDQVQAHKPDLILLDIMMPRMDGFEVLTRLKANPATREIPVIVISASNSLQSVVRGIQLGAEDYLPKPFEPVLLHARISSCLEKKRLRDLQQVYLKSLERELEIGREIQQGFLPAVLPEIDRWEIAAYLQAAHEVAGDFYDAFTLSDGSLVCVLGDVCGKGVGAALFMTLFRSLIRAATTGLGFFGGGKLDELPRAAWMGLILDFINHYIAETHSDMNMFATLFYGIFNPRDGTLTYANCGNFPPVILGQEGILGELRPTGPVIGMVAEAQFAVKQITLEPGQLLLAYTDGIPDALDEQQQPFEDERLRLLLAEGTASAVGLVEKIKSRLRQFTGNAEQFDDITLLAVRRQPA